MRGPDLKPRKLRPSPVRDRIVPSRRQDPRAWHQAYDQKALKAGLCLRCFKPRGPDGSSRYCRPCCLHRAEYARQQKALSRKWAAS